MTTLFESRYTTVVAIASEQARRLVAPTCSLSLELCPSQSLSLSECRLSDEIANVGSWPKAAIRSSY